MASEPITIAQLRQMKRDLDEMKIRAEEMAHTMAAVFGEEDQRVIRAGELEGAIQRLQWALKREEESPAARAGAGGSI